MLTRQAGGYMEPQGFFSFVACWKTKWHSRSGRQLGTSLENEMYSTIRSSRHPPWHLLQWVENICAYKCLHKNVHNSLSHHCQTSKQLRYAIVGGSTVLLHAKEYHTQVTKKWTTESQEGEEKLAMHSGEWKKPRERWEQSSSQQTTVWQRQRMERSVLPGGFFPHHYVPVEA